MKEHHRKVMRMKMMTKIEEVWNHLETNAGNGVLTEPLNVSEKLNCSLGIIGSTKARVFQLGIQPDIEIHNNYLRKFRGVDIQVIPINNGLKNFTILLVDHDLVDVFNLFIEDIISNLESVTDSDGALFTINRRINYWRKLFARAKGQLLSIEHQRGLFGELYLLQLLLQSTDKHHDVIHSWTGPEGSNQDFTLDQTAIEVKTSKSNHPILNISNEEQLNYHNWKDLYLYLIITNETRGGQGTLNNIIKEVICALVDTPDLVDSFQNKLSNLGINPDEYEDYVEIGFSVRKCKCFKVSDGFPIIIKEHLLSDQVFNVKYQIDISSCDPHLIPENRILENFI
ncbi:MAG: PD-(D/E)XK motif protein [Cyclobacteriaceae bacterium]